MSSPTDLEEAQNTITQLRDQVKRLQKTLKDVAGQKDLLRAVLKITCEDCSLKNEQFEMLYSNLNLNPVWHECQKDTDLNRLEIEGLDDSKLPNPKRSPDGPERQCNCTSQHSQSRLPSNKQSLALASTSTITSFSAETNKIDLTTDTKSSTDLSVQPRQHPKENYFLCLPLEMQLCWSDYLDHKSLCIAMSVCAQWREMLSDEELWRGMFERRWKVDTKSDNALSPVWKASITEKPWKTQFATRYIVQQNWVEGKPAVMTLSGHTGTVTSLKFDENRLISGSDDGQLVLWELNKNRDSTHTFPMMMQHHKNSKMARRMASFVGHGGPVWCLDFQDDLLVSGSYDKTIKVWSIKSQNTHCTLRGHDSWVSSIQIHDNHILSGSWDASMKLWKLEETTGGNDYSGSGYLSSYDSKEDQKHRRVSYQGSFVKTLEGAAGNVVYCHQWDHNTGRIDTGCRNHSVQTWDLEAGSVVRTYMGHTKQVYCLQFDESKIVSGSGDHSIKVWDAKSGRCEFTIRGHANPVMSLQFDDAFKMVSGSYDKTIKVWDMRMMQQNQTDEKSQHVLSEVNTLEGHSSAVFCLQFDNDKIVSGSADQNLKVWNFGKLKR